MATVEISQVHKAFGRTQVLKGVDLTIDDGEFIVLLGPSGCGKSTLLRIIAGLEDQSSGEIGIDGARIDHLPPSKREIAMVFQTYALYPHLDVAGNWSLGLRQSGASASLIEERITEAARVLELGELLHRKPAELSGGQRQRVAIGRAIVRHPKVFLFDEPLSNLDAALRSQVRFEIAHLHRRLKSTMIYVTHDQIEAMTLASRIVVIHEGVIQQVGTPAELYKTPANLFVAGFIGSPRMNFLDARADDSGFDFAAAGRLDAHDMHVPRGDYRLGVRPDAIAIVDQGLEARIQITEYLGRQSYLHVELKDERILVLEVDADHPYTAGETVNIALQAEQLHLFDPQTGVRISA